jgi:uncharacterized membrane protein
MPRPRKLTSARIAILAEVAVQRRTLVAALRALPTLEQLAERWGVGVSTLKAASSGRTYRKVSRETD